MGLTSAQEVTDRPVAAFAGLGVSALVTLVPGSTGLFLSGIPATTLDITESRPLFLEAAADQHRHGASGLKPGRLIGGLAAAGNPRVNGGRVGRRRPNRRSGGVRGRLGRAPARLCRDPVRGRNDIPRVCAAGSTHGHARSGQPSGPSYPGLESA